LVALSHTTDLRQHATAESTRGPSIARVSVYQTLADAEPVWRLFQDSGLSTPYQRFEWTIDFAETIGRSEGARILAVCGQDERGTPAVLLPLALNRSRGLRIATMVGGKHANYHMPLFMPSATSMQTGAVKRFLRLTAQAVGGVDAFAFTNQPVEWQRTPNPFARLGGQPSPSNGYKLELNFDGAKIIERILSGESRKKLRKKEKRLSEIGPLTYARATSSTEVAAVLEAFFAQKAMRFEGTGIDNPFADPAAVSFVRRACLDGVDSGSPPIELYSLRAGDKIIATFAGAADRQRFCGMFNSYDMSPEVSRWSPGDLLLIELIRRQCERGLATFDLGVGEARYKEMFCDSIEHLADSFVPTTLKGAAYAGTAAASRAAKRWVKRTPWAWRLARLARSRNAALGSRQD
jgi:CelD/BcsL family acetyltransferase involved in cellulose biosynthesis